MIFMIQNFMKCIDLLVANGVKDVYCVITHGIFTKNALKNISLNSYIKKFIVTNTIPQYSHKLKCPKLEILSVGNLLGDVINCLCTGKSLSNLSCFNKYVKTNSKKIDNKLEKEFIKYELIQ